MKVKRLVAMVGAIFFLGSAVFFAPYCSYALNPQPEPPMTITKIDGAKVTVRDDNGSEKIVAGCPGLKIGDKVTVKGGKIIPEPPKPTVKVNPKGLIQKNAVPGTPDTPNPPPPSEKGLGQIK